MKDICNCFFRFLCFYLEKTNNEIFYIRTHHTHILIPQIETSFLDVFLRIIKDDQIEAGISTFEFPGSKITVSARDFAFSAHLDIL